MQKTILKTAFVSLALALLVMGCEDEKAEAAAPKVVTVSVGGTSTVFEDFSYATDASIFDLLVLWGVTGSDTLIFASFAGSEIEAGTAVALNDESLLVVGMVGNGAYVITNLGTNTSGSFTFSSVGETSAEGSVADNSSLDGIKVSDESTVKATISGPFTATKVAAGDVPALGKAITMTRAID